MHPSRLARRAERTNATLFLPGVICILAGLVGGGLKAAGVDIPVLKTWGGQAVFVVLGLLLVLLSFFVGVGAKPEEWVRPSRGFAGRPFLGWVPSPPERFVAEVVPKFVELRDNLASPHWQPRWPTTARLPNGSGAALRGST